jgi:hypothetical protein
MASVVRDHSEPECALALFDQIRVDHILEFLVPANRAQVPIHICILDRKLVLELEHVLKLVVSKEMRKLTESDKYF